MTEMFPVATGARREFTMRSERYKDLLPSDKLAALGCTVIGVGAIGRQVALQLAAMGVPKLQLIDHDVVETVNLGTQAYCADDVGRPKVHATADLAHQLNPAIEIEAIAGRYAKSQSVQTATFCCVDSIQTRRHIFEAVHRSAQVFIDGRMAAEALRVLTVCDPATAAHYKTTLFDPAEAHREGCTQRSTIYCANVAAGFMVAQLARWLRGLPPERDVSLNLLAMELTAG